MTQIGTPTPASRGSDATPGTTEPIVDVRALAPPARHPRIFDAFERLGPGEAFVLVNDHDPKPLHYQLQAENSGQFSWDYLERGPTTWRVRIGRRAAAMDGSSGDAR